MPAKSKAQQRFMGMVHALNKGEMDPSDASPEVKKVAKSMKKKDAKDFASTKHKGKPNKVKQEWLKEMIRELVAQELNLEGTCGYGEEGELGDEPAGPHLLKIKKESFSELEAEKYDKKLKSAIKSIAKKDRKKGLLLMNFYKKHWVEFMIKSKQALGESILNEGEKEKIEKLLIKYGNTPEDAKQMVNKTYDYIKKAYRNANTAKKAEIMSGLMKFETAEHIVKLVEKCWKGYEKKGTKKMFGKTYPNCVKKENISAIAHLNEMDYRGFVKYMNDFYGPKGLYPDKKKRTLKMKDIGMAYSVLLKKKPNFEIGYDSTDREMLRDILIKLRKLDPDYSQKKESVKEAVDKKQGAEILNQLGGNRFIMMTGAKHFGVGKEGLSFKIGRNSKQVNHIKIDYDRGRDLYNIKFDWVTKRGIKNKKTLKGIYADQLAKVFEKYTGMYTTLY